MKDPRSDKENHLPVLDGVRGMAVLMVMVSHFLQYVADAQSPYAGDGLPRLLAGSPRFAQLGQKGVDLFFVLSGFLITGILLRTKGSDHYFKNFYIRRSLRIFPLYFAVVFGFLAAGAIWRDLDIHWENTWWYICYLQNAALVFWPDKIAGPLHFWSLAVEEHFYLFWPLMVFVLTRRQLIWFSVFVIGISAYMRTAFETRGLNYMFFTPCRMNTLACGALLAVLFADPRLWEVTKKWALRLILLLAGVAFGASIFLRHDQSAFAGAFKFCLYTAFCGVVLIVALAPARVNPARWLFQRGWLRYLGRISYAVYVFHPMVLAGLMYTFYKSHWSPVQGRFGLALILDFLLTSLAVVAVSQISQIVLERPFLKLKDYFHYETRESDSSRKPNEGINGPGGSAS